MAIDFRVRPPFKGFLTAFGRRKDPTVSEETLIEAFVTKLTNAGIDRAVAMGRFVPGGSSRHETRVPNEDVAALTHAYPGLFEGFGSVDVRDPAAAIDEIDKIHGLGLKGIAFDNPWSDPPLYDDDPSLYPLYRRSQELGLIVSLTSSGFVGPDIEYTNPVHIQRVADAFPELTIVVPHGSWPWTNHIAAVLIKNKIAGPGNLYILPDVYLNPPGVPGRRDYIDLIDLTFIGQELHDRVLFASSQPAQDPAEALRDFNSIEFQKPHVRDAVLFKNAERLLGPRAPRAALAA
jgi:predicted TIM-barrel fold metal-dependent hydrolase